MQFPTFDAASKFIDAVKPALECGAARVCEEDGTPLPWLDVGKAGADGEWTRLCICSLENWNLGMGREEPKPPFVVLHCTWPEGSLRRNLPPVFVRVMHLDAIRPIGFDG